MAKIEEHVVVEGDTLWGIAKTYYDNPKLYRQLAEANGIRNPNSIHKGQRLKLPLAIVKPHSVNFRADEIVLDVVVDTPTCHCEAPHENFPYRASTFDVIRRIKDVVIRASAEQGVPVVAVAGSIADEYNTMKGVRRAVDWFQDHVWIHLFSNFDFHRDAGYGFQNKLLNSTMNDLGIGNIKLDTAKKIQELYPETFKAQNWDYTDLVDYVQTDAGTAHIAALVIRQGQEFLGKEIEGYPPRRKEAVLVTFYKQGINTYLGRFGDKIVESPLEHIEPGEGCRVCLQRERILDALGLDPFDPGPPP